MKVLVTGTKGQLGYDVVNELNKRVDTDYIDSCLKEGMKLLDEYMGPA